MMTLKSVSWVLLKQVDTTSAGCDSALLTAVKVIIPTRNYMLT